MDRPPPPVFGSEPSLGEQDLGFLGLEEQEIAPPRPPRGPLQHLGARLARRAVERQERKELEEIRVAPVGRVGTLESELDDFIIRLPSSRDFQELLEQERSSSLFEQYERRRNASVQMTNWAVTLTALLFGIPVLLSAFGWGGVPTASNVLASLMDDRTAVPQLLLQFMSPDPARYVWFVLAVLGVALAFMICTEALSELLTGLRLLALPRILLGLTGLAGTCVGLLFISSHQYLLAFIALLLSRAAMRVLIGLLRAIGVIV